MASPRQEQNEKKKKYVENGAAHIKSTFNNTLITISDQNGNVLSWSSAGSMGFKGSRKNTPYAAGMAAETAAKRDGIWSETG